MAEVVSRSVRPARTLVVNVARLISDVHCTVSLLVSFQKSLFFGRFLVAHSLFFLKGPTKPFPGLWEIPVNPLFNEYNVCPTADQCVFPSSDETDDSDDIVTFLQENFDHHYTTNRAPFQINFHVNWWVHSLKF